MFAKKAATHELIQDLFRNLFKFRRDAMIWRYRLVTEDSIFNYLRSGDCFVISRSPVQARRVAP